MILDQASLALPAIAGLGIPARALQSDTAHHPPTAKKAAPASDLDLKKLAARQAKQEGMMAGLCACIPSYVETTVVNHESLVPKVISDYNRVITYTGSMINEFRHNLNEKPTIQDVKLFLLPIFKRSDHYKKVTVNISAKHLLHASNIALRFNAVWGTDVYTDDSDIVAALIHAGYYHPTDLAIKEILHCDLPRDFPDHDLIVELCILPRLVKYGGSTQHGIKSKSWGASHGGESYKILRVEKIALMMSPKRQRKKQKVNNSSPGRFVNLVTSSSFESDFCFVYDKEAFIRWPQHINDAVHAALVDPSKHDILASFRPIVKTSKIEISDLKALGVLKGSQLIWPYWRLKVADHYCLFEDTQQEKYRLSQVGADEFRIENLTSGRVVLCGTGSIEWTDDGVIVEMVKVVIVKYFWQLK